MKYYKDLESGEIFAYVSEKERQEWGAQGLAEIGEQEMRELTSLPDQSLEEWREATSISARQGEQQLILSGLDEQVEAAIDGIADTTERKLTRAWYRRATVWERNNPQLIALGQALELTDGQIDDLFSQASEL